MFLKQLVWRSLVTALSFAIGVAVSLPWPSPDAPHAKSYALSACDALQSPALYGRENVRLRGALYGNRDGTLVLNELDCSGEGAWITVNFTDSLAEKDEIRQFIDRMRKQSMNDTMARAEVVVVGKLETQSASLDSEPRYAISAIELEPLTPISIISFGSN